MRPNPRCALLEQDPAVMGALHALAEGDAARGSAGRGVNGFSDPPEHLLTSFHTAYDSNSGIWQSTDFSIVLAPLTP